MRSILEKAIVAVLNEEGDKAKALFHKFMVERARQIHESLRQGDEVVLAEGWDDEITSEEYFAEGDLTDAEDDAGLDDAADTIGDDLGVETGDDFGGDVDGAGDDLGGDVDDVALDGAADDMGGDVGDDMGGDLGDEPVGDSGDLGDRLDDVESQIEALTAEFESMMAEIDGDESAADDAEDAAFDAEDAAADAEGDLEDAEDTETDESDDAAEDFGGEAGDDASEDGAEEEEEDDLDDITESVISELEKISVTLADGKEVGDGGTVAQNNKSPIPMEKVDARVGGKPVGPKGPQHSGFEREAAPGTKPVPVKARNTKGSAKDFQSTVPEGGDKSANLHKDFAGGTKPTRSPIAGK